MNKAADKMLVIIHYFFMNIKYIYESLHFLPLDFFGLQALCTLANLNASMEIFTLIQGIRVLEAVIS
jgi:hypothetical protein